MTTYNYYETLIKPTWSPPAEVFGPVWTFLYALIIISFGYAVYLYFRRKINFLTLLPFLLNLVFNLAFTPIQFGLQNLPLASVDVILVLVTLIWAMIVIYKHSRWITLLNIPYLLWVIFATILQLTITFLNI